MRPIRNLGMLCAALLLLAFPASAGVGTTSNAIVWFNSPTTMATVLSGYCTDGNLTVNLDTGIYYSMSNCNGTALATQFSPVLEAAIPGLTSDLSGKFNVPVGSTSQYLRGDGTPATLATGAAPESGGNLYFTNGRATSAIAAAYFTGTSSQYVRGDGSLGSRSWASPSRALASCFQISATNDADFHYKVDVASGTLLSGTVTGTVTATSYTNSGCTTGAQVEADGQSSQGAALGILSVTQTASVALDGTVKGGKWLQLSTANTSGTPTFTIRTAQREVTQP